MKLGLETILTRSTMSEFKHDYGILNDLTRLIWRPDVTVFSQFRANFSAGRGSWPVLRLSTPPEYPPWVWEGIEASQQVPGVLSGWFGARNRPTAQCDVVVAFSRDSVFLLLETFCSALLCGVRVHGRRSRLKRNYISMCFCRNNVFQC